MAKYKTENLMGGAICFCLMVSEGSLNHGTEGVVKQNSCCNGSQDKGLGEKRVLRIREFRGPSSSDLLLSVTEVSATSKNSITSLEDLGFDT